MPALILFNTTASDEYFPLTFDDLAGPSYYADFPTVATTAVTTATPAPPGAHQPQHSTPSWASEVSDGETSHFKVQASIPSDTCVVSGHSEIQTCAAHSERQLPQVALGVLTLHCSAARSIEKAEKWARIKLKRPLNARRNALFRYLVDFVSFNSKPADV